MRNREREHEEQHPSLSQALIELREQTVRLSDDVARVMGILDNIHNSTNEYDLLHRIKSLLGRERSMMRMVRRWVATLEPLERVAHSLGEKNA